MFRIQSIFRTLPNIYNEIFYLKPYVALTYSEPLVYSELWYILKPKHIRNPAKYLRLSILLRTNGAISQKFAKFFFAKFTRKHLCRSLFFIKLQVSVLQLHRKKKTLTQVFSDEFCDILRTPFLQNTSKRLLLFYGKIFYQ